MYKVVGLSDFKNITALSARLYRSVFGELIANGTGGFYFFGTGDSDNAPVRMYYYDVGQRLLKENTYGTIKFDYEFTQDFLPNRPSLGNPLPLTVNNGKLYLR